MILITGRSGSGKTTILKKINNQNVYFADEFVKDVLYKNSHQVSKEIYKIYPTTKALDRVNTKELGRLILSDENKLNHIHKLVHPFVLKWLKSLPKDSIVEMATYLKYESMYKGIFSTVILISRDILDLSKFNHIKNVVNPIPNIDIKYDYKIENNTSVDKVVKHLKSIITNELTKK